MDRLILLLLAGLLAGFALVNAPLTGFLAGISPVTDVIGILAILIFLYISFIKDLRAC